MLQNLEREPLSVSEINREKKFCNKHIFIGYCDDNFVRFQNLELDNCILEVTSTRMDVIRLSNVTASVLVVDTLRAQRMDLISCKIEKLIIMSSSESSMYLTSFNIDSTSIQHMEVEFNNSYDDCDVPRIYMDLGSKAVIGYLSLKNTNSFKYDFYIYSNSLRTSEEELSSNSLIDTLYLEGFTILDLSIPSLCMSLSKVIIGPQCAITDELSIIPEMEINLNSNEDYPVALREGIQKDLGRILDRHRLEAPEEIFLKPLATLGGLYRFLQDISNGTTFDDLTLKALYPFIKIKEKSLILAIPKNETIENIRKEIRNHDSDFDHYDSFSRTLYSMCNSNSVRKGERIHFNKNLMRLNLRASHNAGYIFLQTTK